ncbi:hypothetical protein RD792_004639 [Penstemon davidsonii]|uniref:SNF2 N-terminal domain-containing protein n=1 Tax=Penstemon davidsonii TaxID=160366 RepID=A0ABR0DIF5_9LAMI|nr:hypothetical protein RD792_004639 [Penstemon davidsonii]
MPELSILAIGSLEQNAEHRDQIVTFCKLQDSIWFPVKEVDWQRRRGCGAIQSSGRKTVTNFDPPNYEIEINTLPEMELRHNILVYASGNWNVLRLSIEYIVLAKQSTRFPTAKLTARGGDSMASIFHKVEWHRVVLDEAHTIKSYKSLGAQAAFGLSSYCRCCIIGTPIQNDLKDLYSLLCFLLVELWCNWEWIHGGIQRWKGHSRRTFAASSSTNITDDIWRFNRRGSPADKASGT